MITLQALQGQTRWLPRLTFVTALTFSAAFGPTAWPAAPVAAELGDVAQDVAQNAYIAAATDYVSLNRATAEAQSGTISGVVFRDYNADGVRGSFEPGVEGVMVRGYDAQGNMQQTTTSFSGTYTLPSFAGKVRVEFTTPASLSFLKVGASGGTTVQFVDATAGPVTNVNVGFNTPSGYCGVNPRLCVPAMKNGTGVTNTSGGIVSFLYDVAGGSPAYEAGDVPNGIDALGTAANPRGDSTISQVGAVWGLGSHRSTQRVFASAMLKRHSGLGPMGIGGVYVLDYSNPLFATLATSLTLQGVIPANSANALSGGVIDLGSVIRTGGPQYILPDDSTQPSVDLDAFAKVGKVAFGDIDVSDDDGTLWLVNTNQKSLISIDLSNFNPAIHRGNTLTGLQINQYLIPSLPNAPVCIGGALRPWGLKFYDTRGYIGMVCDAETSQNRANLWAYVMSFDPANPAAGLRAELNYSLNFVRESNMPGGGAAPDRWNPWATTWLSTTLVGSNAAFPSSSYPQPVLSDIEIASDGSLIMGFFDRTGHQAGYNNYPATPGTLTQFNIVPAGDIVHACRTSSGFVIEGPTCRPTDSDTTMFYTAARADDGPSGVGEFYHEDHYYQTVLTTVFGVVLTHPLYSVYHSEVELGGLVVVPGTGEVVSTVNDPVDWAIAANGSNRGLNTMGVHWYNTITGTLSDSYLISHSLQSNNGALGKANGLGDLELLCDAAPIELGNRVWYDKNSNGIQDADEDGIPNVKVELFGPGSLIPIATAYTNGSGQYFFKNGTETLLTSLDHIGLVSGNIQQYTDYTITVSLEQTATVGFTTTMRNSDNILSNDPILDIRDSDALSVSITSLLFAKEANEDAKSRIGINDALNAGTSIRAVILVRTGGAGVNNHSFDFGFRALQPNIDLQKEVNAADADMITGPYILVGRPVTFTYYVTNTGEMSLTNFSLFDDKLGQVPVANCLPSPVPLFNVGASTTCIMTDVAILGQYTNTAVVTFTTTLTNPFLPGAVLTRTDPAHYYGALPSILVAKATNGLDVPNAPGPVLAVGGPVTWTYNVTNTGNITLVNIALSDDKLGPITCPLSTLPAGATMLCSAMTGVAILGQYTNTAIVTGTTPPGTVSPPIVLTSTKPSYYFGVDPRIVVTKLTNGIYATSGTGPAIPVGSTVTWTYLVTNTGNVTLTNIVLNDDKVGAITCPQTSLNVGVAMNCSATGVAVLGQYINNVAVTATHPLTNSGKITPTVVATSTSRYIGGSASIVVIKLTNGAGDAPQDADDMPGPLVAAGTSVTWTYRVTNTGTVTLSNITLLDDKVGAITCPATTLLAGIGMTCTAIGVAIVGQYTNTATITATPPPGLGLPPMVTSTNPSHYFGVDPRMIVTKLTNGVNVANATGPILAVGAPVTWTYLVTNTGNVTLTNIVMNDDKVGPITCPATSLLVNGSMSCTATGFAVAGQYINTVAVTATHPLTNGGKITPTITMTTPSRYLGGGAAIQLIKLTNGAGDVPQDADNIPGPLVGTGAAVTWTYRVTNTGFVTLTNIVIIDDKLGGVTCPASTLAPGAGMTCLANGVAIIGQYTNTAVATGVPPAIFGLPPVTSTNPSHYFGVNPKLDLTKLTNGVIARSGTGPAIAVGSPVTWTYLVTNTGNVTLTNIVVNDNKVGLITCPSNQLLPAAMMTCTAAGVATAGQYINNVSVTSTHPLTNGGTITPTVVKTDTSRYFGAVSGLGDFVWIDVNRNGIQDQGELGLGNVTVRLINADTNTVLSTTTTNIDGYYGFNDLPPGRYIVQFVLPLSYTFTNQYAGDPTRDSNANPITGASEPVLLVAGQIITTIDAGLWQPLIPAGLGDFVWIDVNHNGLQDPGEVGLGNVTVRLLNADTNTEVGITTTNAGGYYGFSNLTPGRYVVQFVLPPNYSFTTQNAGDPARNSDADPNTGRTQPVTLVAGQVITTVDAGLWQPMAIGDYVWNDANNDGAVNGNELGFKNVLVELYEDTNNDGQFEPGTDKLVSSTQTDNTGKYLFNNLVPGKYFVILPAANFVPGGQLAALYPSTTAVASDTNLNNRNHGVGVGVLGNDGYVASSVISLVANQQPITDGDSNPNTNLTIDFGLNDKNPTAVSLLAFHSQRQVVGNVTVKWVTGQEIDTYGFVLYRSEGMATSSTMPASAVKVTDQIIVGKGRAQGGASYEWVDHTVQPGKVYTYWLVEIENGGDENNYGPAAPSFKGGARVLLPLLMRR